MEPATTPWIQAIISSGAFGVVAWLVWHTFSNTLPKMQDENRKYLVANRDEFTKTINKQFESFEKINKEQREDFKLTLETQREYFAQQIKVFEERCLYCSPEIRRARIKELNHG